MNYRDTLHAIETTTALEIIGIGYEPKGAYVALPCPNKCECSAVMKTYGDKKNLWYCPKCKKGGNLLRLAMDTKGVEYDAAKELLSKAIVATAAEIKEPLNVTYALDYPKYLEDRGIPKPLCEELEIGQPRGRTMLAGCIAFTVFNEDVMKVAYYGLQMKDRKPKFHTSFNPERYLYNFHRTGRKNDLVVCTDILLCVRSLVEGKQAISTFDLPYLSTRQMELLNQCHIITVFRADSEIVRHVAAHYSGHVRFIGQTNTPPWLNELRELFHLANFGGNDPRPTG